MATKGTPTILNYLADLSTPYVISSLNIVVTKPDSTVYSGLATSSPSVTAQNPQTLSTMYVPDQAGRHQGYFQGIVSGQTLNFPFDFWVTWNDVYSKVRALLSTTPTKLPDFMLDPFLNSIYEELSFLAKGLPAYNTFTSAYQLAYDDATTFLLASQVRPTIGGKRPTGEVSGIKKGTTEITYAIGQPKQEFTQEKIWWDKGMNMLEYNIPEIRSAMYCNRSGDETMTRGPLAQGNYHPEKPWRVLPTGGSILAFGVDGADGDGYFDSVSDI